MLKIYQYDEENFKIVFRLDREESIKIVSKILSKIDDNIYVDWQYILEEINEKNSIIGKKISIELIKTQKKNFLLISPLLKEVEILAVIPV